MIKEKLSLVPKLPGCYLMKNEQGIVIYVGKAKILKNRLKSYFNGRVTGKTKKLVSEIVDFDYIVTGSELEAFILEINLIKKYDPKYNILLKDDKSYPYIEFKNEKYPSLTVKREININKKNKMLFGPYPNVYAARRLVNLINRLYPLKKCDKMPKKECLYYHIGECLGYCVFKDVDTTDLRNEIISILNGHDEILINKISEKIKVNSDNLNFEVALELKNELDYIKVVFERQKVELNDGVNRDIFNYYYENGYISIVVFFLRNGKLVGNKKNIFPLIDDIKETLEYYIVNFYSKKNLPPKEVIVPDILDLELLNSVIDSKVITTVKGRKKHLFDLALTNAKINLENNIEMEYRNNEKNEDACEELGNILGIPNLSVIESFDNSNLFGSFTVSGMVTFIDGSPSKKDYRKFKISKEQNDDVGSMKEVIYRRYQSVLVNRTRIPDLILVDGGINQINACNSVLNDLNLHIKVCGLAKDDKHSLSELIDGDTMKSYKIDKRSNVFYLLTRISDEVHRFTINYHRQIRSKGSISSVLDEVEGIGNTRKKELMKKFGSLKKMTEASLEEIESIVPHNVAVNLKKFLDDFRKEKESL
jgi:excinuclease ABC subunit C